MTRLTGTASFAFMVLAAASFAASADSQQTPGVYDPVSKTFQLTITKQPATSQQLYYGTLQITSTINLDSGIVANPPVTVTANVAVSINDTSGDIVGGIEGPVQVSGSTGSVTLNLPYSWLLSSSSDKVNLTLTVSATYYDNTGQGYNPSGIQQVSIPLPANGTTTVVNIPNAL